IQLPLDLSAYWRRESSCVVVTKEREEALVVVRGIQADDHQVELAVSIEVRRGGPVDERARIEVRRLGEAAFSISENQRHRRAAEKHEIEVPVRIEVAEGTDRSRPRPHRDEERRPKIAAVRVQEELGARGKAED